VGEYREDFRREGALAVPAGAARPDIASAEALRSVLLTADALYFPDPERATAGIHFVKVLRELGIHERLAARCRTFANGATAMRGLAAAGSMHSLGCTQITEINYTEGVTLVGPLPDDFELSTPLRGGRHAPLRTARACAQIHRAAIGCRVARAAFSRRLRVCRLSGIHCADSIRCASTALESKWCRNVGRR
jgi:hypothetical protein